jgi:hypothetical protein
VLRVRTLALLFVLTSAAMASDETPSLAPDTVVVPSGKLRLKAFLGSQTGRDLSLRFSFVTALAAPMQIVRLVSR